MLVRGVSRGIAPNATLAGRICSIILEGEYQAAASDQSITFVF
jgi:hypothetical protein